MTPAQKRELRSVLVETAVYGVLVAAYCLAVLRFGTPTLVRLFHQHRTAYAALALGLMVVQGLVLEMIARALVHWLSPKPKARA